MSDNGLHLLKPRKGDVSDLLSEHVTCSGARLPVFARRGAVVCDYACLMFGCCTCFKCHGWFTAASSSSDAFCLFVLFCRKQQRRQRRSECESRRCRSDKVTAAV